MLDNGGKSYLGVLRVGMVSRYLAYHKLKGNPSSTSRYDQTSCHRLERGFVKLCVFGDVVAE